MSGPAIRLLALDLDGTILKGERGITPRVRASIAAAQAHGVQVTIATGRMFQSARRFAHSLDVQVPIICYQGALIRHPVRGQAIVSTVLPIEPAFAVHAFAKSADLQLNAYVDDELYMERGHARGTVLRRHVRGGHSPDRRLAHRDRARHDEARDRDG